MDRHPSVIEFFLVLISGFSLFLLYAVNIEIKSLKDQLEKKEPVIIQVERECPNASNYYTGGDRD